MSNVTAPRYFTQLPVALYLLAVPLVGIATERWGGNDLARIAQIALGLVCAAWAIALWAQGNWLIVKPALVVGVVSLVLAIASAALASMPTMAFRELALFAGLAAVALVIGRARDLTRAPGALTSIAGGLYVAVVVMLFVLATAAGQTVNRPDLFIGYDSYRFFNHVQTAALPLAVLSAVLASVEPGWPRWLRVVAWCAAIGGFALLFATMGRGTLVGIAGATALVLVIFGRRAFPLARAMAIAAGSGLVFFAALFLALPVLMGVEPALHSDFYGPREGSAQVRFMLWGIALDHIRAAPWLGIGPMHYAHYPTGDASHPHNFYLQVAAEFGLPFFLIVVALALAGARRMVAAIRTCEAPAQRLCGMGLLLACLAIAIDALFSGNLVMPVSQVWAAFTVGWSVAWMRSLRRSPESAAATKVSPAPAIGRWLASALLLSQVWLTIDAWPQAVDLDSYLQEAARRFPTAVTNPRFWSHGWF